MSEPEVGVPIGGPRSTIVRIIAFVAVLILLALGLVLPSGCLILSCVGPNLIANPAGPSVEFRKGAMPARYIATGGGPGGLYFVDGEVVMPGGMTQPLRGAPERYEWIVENGAKRWIMRTTPNGNGLVLSEFVTPMAFGPDIPLPAKTYNKMLMGVSRSGPTLSGDDATGSMGLHILRDDGTWNFVAFPERIEAGFEIPSSEIFVMSSAAGPLIIAERGPKGFRVLQRIEGKRSNLIGRTSDAIVASVDGRIQSVSKAPDGLGVAIREVDVGRHEIWPGGAIKARDGRIWVASVGSVNADTTWIRERLQGDPPYILTFKAPHNVFQAVAEEE